MTASSCEDYLAQLFEYLCQNDRSMDLNQITHKFGSIRKLIPVEEGKPRQLKKVLERDAKSRFLIETKTSGKQKGLTIVRAAPASSSLSNATADANTNIARPLPSNAQDYRDLVYNHLLKNNIAMNISNVELMFGSVDRFASNDATAKTLFGQDSRFILDSFNHGAMWTVRASQSANQPSPEALRSAIQPSTEAPRLANQPLTEESYSVHSNNNGKVFTLADDTKTKCYFVDNPVGLSIVAEKIRQFLQTGKAADSLLGRVISIGCCSHRGSLELFQLATSQPQVYIVDCQNIQKEAVLAFLKPLLEDQSLTKLVHNLYEDALVLHEFCGNINILRKVLDAQLLAELVWRSKPSLELNDFLLKLDLPNHPGRNFFEARQRAGYNPWDKRPAAQASLEYAAYGVACLQNASTKICNLLLGTGHNYQHRFEQLLSASAARASHAIENPSFRTLCFDTKRGFVPCSTELIQTCFPNDGFYGDPLTIECDIDEILSILPAMYTTKFAIPSSSSETPSSTTSTNILDLFAKNPSPASSKAKSTTIMQMMATSTTSSNSSDGQDTSLLPLDKLGDIALDIGRRAVCWISNSRVFLCEDPHKLVNEEDLAAIVSKLGTFGSDNRAGLKTNGRGSLHRFSAMRDRCQNIVGLTIRVGRHVRGNASMMMDLLRNHPNKSILILGEPGSGKTTIVREATRVLAHDGSNNVIVIDTSNEIAGDGTTAHSCIGLARRMMVQSLEHQAQTMIECLQNHTPHTMVIDEIGRPKEVRAASTAKQRGLRIIASAHGDLRKLLKNGDLNGLVGGLETVTIGDELAKEQAKEKQKQQLRGGSNTHDSTAPQLQISKSMTQRRTEPIFEIIVEVSRESKHDWRIVHDSAVAVDRILEGNSYPAELRRRNPQTGALWTKQVDA